MSKDQEIRKAIIQSQIEVIIGYYNKIFMNKMTVDEILDTLEKDKEFLQEEQNILDAELIVTLDESPSPSEAGDAIEIIDGYTQLAIDKRSLPKDGQHVKFMTENEEFHEGYFVGGDDIFHVTDSKFFFKWHVQQWKGI